MGGVKKLKIMVVIYIDGYMYVSCVYEEFVFRFLSCENAWGMNDE